MIETALTFLFALIVVVLFYQFPVASFCVVVLLGLLIALYHFFDFFRIPSHLRTKIRLIEIVKSLAIDVTYLILSLLMIIVIAFWKSVHTQDGPFNVQDVIRKRPAEIQKNNQ